MELVQNTKGYVSQSPKAATVTLASFVVAVTAVALLIAGVRTRNVESVAAGQSAPPHAVAKVSSLAGLSPQARRHIVATESLVPAQLVPARSSATEGRPSDRIERISSMTPVQLIEAFGTDARAAAVLANLTPRERLNVESIMTMTPAQLRAAFGTATPGARGSRPAAAVGATFAPKRMPPSALQRVLEAAYLGIPFAGPRP